MYLIEKLQAVKRIEFTNSKIEYMFMIQNALGLHGILYSIRFRC